MARTSQKGITGEFKLSFLFVGVLIFFLIVGNIFGQLLLERIRGGLQSAKKTFELVQYQKVSLTLFVSSSSNSVIGLAIDNWEMLLAERKIISKQIEQFEALSIKIRESLRGGEFHSLQGAYSEIEQQWLEAKRQNVLVLRAKNTELSRNEALLEFITTTKALFASFQNFQTSVQAAIIAKESRAEATGAYISYFNAGFQIAAIPMLIFFIFIPGLRRAHELEALRASQISMSKLSALGEMAAGVAHEINNPLAIIKNLSSQMNEMLAENDFNRGLFQEMTQKIEKTSDRIAKIVRGLRTFSRNGSKDEFQNVNIKHIVEETIALCKERFANNRIILTLDEIPADLIFNGRETEISQVILNLLNNAYDAIEVLPEKWVKISVFDQPTTIEIRVTDSGKGIPESERQKVFQPFYTTKEIGKGTGLGLSVSIGIIKAHGGDLSIDGNYPNTCFVIQLPKSSQAKEDAKTA